MTLLQANFTYDGHIRDRETHSLATICDVYGIRAIRLQKTQCGRGRQIKDHGERAVNKVRASPATTAIQRHSEKMPGISSGPNDRNEINRKEIQWLQPKPCNRAM